MVDIETPPDNAATTTLSNRSHSISKKAIYALLGTAAFIGLTFGLGFSLSKSQKSGVSSVQSSNLSASSNGKEGDDAGNGGGASTTSSGSKTTDQGGDDKHAALTETEVVPEVLKEETKYYRSDGPLVAQVKMMSPSVASGYATCLDLESDIAQALKHYGNKVIMEQSVNGEIYAECDPNNPNWYNDLYSYDYTYDYVLGPAYYYDYNGDENGGGNSKRRTTNEINAPKNGKKHKRSPTLKRLRSDPRSTDKTKDSAPSAEDKENSFHANNVVDGVDTSDIVKSNGEFVFSGFGDVLYAWNASDGTQGVSMTKIPGDFNECEDPFIPCTYLSKPRVQSLFLHEKRLTAVITQDSYNWVNPENYTSPIVYDYSILSVRVYDITDISLDGSPLKELGHKNISGNFFMGQSVEERAHIVSYSYIDTSASFVQDLYRSQPQYCGLNNSEYMTAAADNAVNNDVESFAKQMMLELQLEDADCSNIFQISMLQEDVNGDDTSSSMPDMTGGNLLTEFVHITSFDMSSDYGADRIINASVSGLFTPEEGYLSAIHVTRDAIFAASNGYVYDYATATGYSNTYILGFDATSGAAIPSSFGKVGGSLATQFSLSMWDGHLRVATTDYNWTDSTVSNKILVLRVPGLKDGPTMEVVGKAKIPVADVYSASLVGMHFFEDKAYASISEATYGAEYVLKTVNLSNHSDPHAVSELSLPGYSTLMYNVEIDETSLLLMVGEHWNDINWVSSMILTLVDVSDPLFPKLVANYSEEGSSTGAQWDLQMLRLLPTGILIIPKTTYVESSDNGLEYVQSFAAFELSKDGIKLLHNKIIEFEDSCWYPAYIPQRSFVFESKLTTIMGHMAVSSDLKTGDKYWDLDLDVGLNYSFCEPYVYGDDYYYVV